MVYGPPLNTRVCYTPSAAPRAESLQYARKTGKPTTTSRVLFYKKATEITTETATL